jgi:transposase
MSVVRAAKQLSLPKSGLENWIRAAREGKLAEVGKGQRLASEVELELARIRKELANVKMERDLLKKFAPYFAKESR